MSTLMNFDHSKLTTGKTSMNITELLITGYDDAAILFATTLTADEAKIIRPGSTSIEGEAVVGEVWQQATDAFTAVRDLMTDLLSSQVSS